MFLAFKEKERNRKLILKAAVRAATIYTMKNGIEVALFRFESVGIILSFMIVNAILILFIQK